MIDSLYFSLFGTPSHRHPNPIGVGMNQNDERGAVLTGENRAAEGCHLTSALVCLLSVILAALHLVCHILTQIS